MNANDAMHANDAKDARDHRQIGQEMDLFHFQEEAPGMVFWHPRGFILYRLLEETARHRLARDGYDEVRSPQVLRQSVWEKSGHWDHFRENMFLLDDEPERAAALKPVSCPGHIQIFKNASRSYRALPMRLAEFGAVHRKEPSGTLHGLFRLRQFTQDDGHIFCAPEHVVDEVARFCSSVVALYRDFGFEDIEVALSTRPPSRIGDDALWDRAEAHLADAAKTAGLEARIEPGAGAFYGPKIEFVLSDRVGRKWQCGTIQLDYALPERFDMAYVDASGARVRPVMLHRAIYGSLERFLGIVLEHHAGRLPAWLAPDQVVIAPVSPDHEAYAREVLARLVRENVRAQVDERSESLARRVAEAHAAGAPFVLVVGDRERIARTVNVRARDRRDEMSLEAAAGALRAICAPPWAAREIHQRNETPKVMVG